MVHPKMMMWGKVCKNLTGESIPQKILRYSDSGRKPDCIIIRENPTSDGEEFYLYVSEEDIDDDGGKMGQILDKMSKEKTGKSMPAIGYDNALEADIYKLGYGDLCKVWDLYTGKGEHKKKELTDAQMRARQVNMDKALEALKKKRDDRRKGRLRGR
jgi:hypothetical protein